MDGEQESPVENFTSGTSSSVTSGKVETIRSCSGIFMDKDID